MNSIRLSTTVSTIQWLIYFVNVIPPSAVSKGAGLAAKVLQPTLGEGV